MRGNEIRFGIFFEKTKAFSVNNSSNVATGNYEGIIVQKPTCFFLKKYWSDFPVASLHKFRSKTSSPRSIEVVRHAMNKCKPQFCSLLTLILYQDPICFYIQSSVVLCVPMNLTLYSTYIFNKQDCGRLCWRVRNCELHFSSIIA